MIAGRPLRFLGLIVGGWIAMRATVLWWPIDAEALPETEAVKVAKVAPARKSNFIVAEKLIPGWPSIRSVAPVPIVSRTATRGFVLAPRQSETTAGSPHIAKESGIIPGLPSPTPQLPDREYQTHSRFSGSFWLLARGGSGPAGGVLGAQLGGSQAGARLTYALTDSRRLALAVRASTPLGPGAQELAFGLEWQPTRLPVRVIAEHRIPLNGGRGGPTLGLVGGFGPKPIARGFALEGYAQGGVIARDNGEGFADGAARLARPVAHLGAIRFDLGAGAWGAAQRGASRIDLGPSLVAHVPIGRQPVRASLDWRQRVVGNAVPNSGLVFTLGADF